MALSIKTSYDACRRAFDDFVEFIEDPTKENPEELRVQTWRDELGRLRMWAGNIGAHQSGQSSLDFRLRDSSHIREKIITLLDDLPQRLQDVKEVILEGEDEDLVSLGESDSGQEPPQTQIQQLRENVGTIINCLFEMSMLVRTPARNDHRIGSNKADVAHYELHDCNHVRSKYPAADEQLASRLGRAITRRRMYLKYRERHAMKLRQGLDPGSIDDHGSDILSETVATGVQARSINFNDRASESGFSETSYAPTLISGGNVTIPTPPRASRNCAPFECPYCHFIITVNSTRSWTRHVFNDLQPYVCTHTECTTPDILFTTRHEWLDHVKMAHSSHTHSGTNLGQQDQQHKCELCGAFLASETRHSQHLARHMQELALFIRPPDEEDPDDDSHDGETGSNQSVFLSDRSDIYSDDDSDTLEVSRPMDEAHALDTWAERDAEVDTDGKLYQGVDTTQEDDNVVGTSGKRLRSGPGTAGDIEDISQDHTDPTETTDLETVRQLIEDTDAGQIYLKGSQTRDEEEADKAFEVRMRDTLLKAGYSEESIEKTLERRIYSREKREGRNVIDVTRPTYIKVHRKQLSPDTLDWYELPWEWDRKDSDYMIIKRWVSEQDQDILFEHTRKLREPRLLNKVGDKSPIARVHKPESIEEGKRNESSASSLNSGRPDSGRYHGNLPIPSPTNLQLESGLQEYAGGQRRGEEEEDNDKAANQRINEEEIAKDIRESQRRGSSSSLPLDPELEQKLQRLAELETKEEKENLRLRLEEERIREEARKDREEKFRTLESLLANLEKGEAKSSVRGLKTENHKRSKESD